MKKTIPIKVGFGSMPSSGELGQLMYCEDEFVHVRRTGQSSTDARLKQRSEEGKAAHDQAQVAMESFHNRPRTTHSPSSSDSSTPKPSTRDSRCFVASTVYGTNAPETEVLRAFRDRSLSSSAVGRAFVRGYYQLSPSVASWLGKRPLAARAVRHGLDVVVKAVQSRPHA